VLEALRRRKEIVAIFTVAVPAAVLVASLLEDPAYEATATVLVRAQGGAGVSADDAIELAETDEVVERTGEKLGGVDSDYISERVVIEGGEGREVFTVQGTGSFPEYAARLTNSFAAEFVEYSNGLGETFPAEAEVAERAVPPDTQASPRTVRNTLIGVGAGFLLGVVIALLWESFSGRRARPAPATTSPGPPAGRGGKPAEAPTLSPVPDLAEMPEPAQIPDGPVDLNSITYEQLRALDLSTTQARRLLTYRERRGGFSSVDEIDEIPGFPDGMRAELKRRVRV
jgi:capsular polysaccharide biosynthesis protein